MTTIFTDNFNRADAGTLGANWTVDAGTWSIASNLVTVSGSAGLLVWYNGAVSTTDYESELTAVTTGAFMGPVVRRTSSNTYYQMLYDGSTGFYMQQVSGGTATQIGSTVASGFAANDVLKCSAQGTGATVTLKMYKNGTQLGSNISDSTGTRITSAGTGGMFCFNGAGTFDNFSMYSLATTSTTVAGPNAAAVIPSNHNGNIVLTLVGTGTAWTGSTTWAVAGVAGWAFVSKAFTDTTHYTVTVSAPAVASPPAGATGNLTLTEGVTGSVVGTIAVGTPTLSSNPASAVVSAGATVLTFTGTNTLWQGDNPQFSISALTGTSIGASTATTNTASSATLTVGSTVGTTTITDPSTGAQVVFSVNAAGSFLLRSRQVSRFRSF